jgi:hypothetical protein
VQPVASGLELDGAVAWATRWRQHVEILLTSFMDKGRNEYKALTDLALTLPAVKHRTPAVRCR